MQIIYEDNRMLIVDKPAGQLVQSGKNFDLDLVSEAMMYRQKKGEEAYAAVINRLDRPVRGLVVLAKTKKAAAELTKAMQQQEFCKIYMALVSGQLQKKSGTLVDYLQKDGKTNMSSVVSENVPNAKLAKLEYTVEAELENATLVRVHLLTGRHHQIRVQFANQGHALLGDKKYGTVDYKRNQIALCACELTVEGKIYKIPEPWFE